LIQRLPGLLQFIEFHVHAPVVAAPVIRSRSFCLMRPSLVATLVSLMPRISAISA
jgi:hypothetical protein